MIDENYIQKFRSNLLIQVELIFRKQFCKQTCSVTFILYFNKNSQGSGLSDERYTLVKLEYC